MRSFLAAILLAPAVATAGSITVYMPDRSYAIIGTSFVSTAKTQGDFVVLDASVATRPPAPKIKAKGFSGFSGIVSTSPQAAGVTFLDCILLDFQAGENGLLHYEVFCAQQVGSF